MFPGPMQHVATAAAVQRRRCSAVNGLTPLLRGDGCIMCNYDGDRQDYDRCHAPAILSRDNVVAHCDFVA